MEMSKGVMTLKFGEAVTMIADRYGWNAFDNLNAINDPELVTAVEVVRTVRKKDPVRSTGPGADLRRTRPPRKELEKMVDKGMTYAEIGEAIGSTPETASKTVRVYGLSDRYWLMHGRYNLIKSEPYRKLVEQKKAELKSLIDHGATDVAIGAELGMTVGRVKYWIKEWNLGRNKRITRGKQHGKAKVCRESY
ncbi:hypothetical protein [Ligilactobacillus sp.]|uniref:hypothetical protein n=1 Tax=Ligilactobacillus sp. TaxID=2767921 RepID=UPI002FDF8E56